MTSKHTPGPWRVESIKRNLSGTNPMFKQWRHTVETAHPNEKLQFQIVELFGKESEGNARLIAAAPELLEALENLLSGQIEWGGEGDGRLDAVISIPREHYNFAKAAVRKVRGVL